MLSALLLVACAKKSSLPNLPESPTVPGSSPRYGNEGGNGGDTLSPENGSAWFLTPMEAGKRRYLSICYERGSDFHAAETVIRQAISNAIDNWEVYLDFKAIFLSDGKRSWKPTVAYMPSVVSNTYASDPS